MDAHIPEGARYIVLEDGDEDYLSQHEVQQLMVWVHATLEAD